LPNLIVFAGNSHPELAKRVAHQLRIDLGAADVDRFSDGEVRVEIHENVRGRDVFMLQSTCAPTNDNLMELMVMADAIKRASASRITAVMPYFGYARQDRRPRSAKMADERSQRRQCRLSAPHPHPPETNDGGARRQR